MCVHELKKNFFYLKNQNFSHNFKKTTPCLLCTFKAILQKLMQMLNSGWGLVQNYYKKQGISLRGNCMIICWNLLGSQSFFCVLPFF